MSDLRGLISIARKGGFVIIGQENLASYDKKLYLVLLDNTAGASLEREMKFLSEKRNIPILRVDHVADLTRIENCKVIGIKNKNLSEEIERIVKGD